MKQIILSFGSIIFIVGLAVCSEQSVLAQMNYYNFGQTPTLSPYLALENRREGVLDNFNQFVRPRLEAQAIMNQTQNQLNRQGASQRAMSQQIMMRNGMDRSLSNATAGGIGMQRGPSLTGQASQAATFRNYSHYYRK